MIAAVDLDLLNGNKLHHPPTYNLASFTQSLADQTAACCNFEEPIRKLEVVLIYKGVFLTTAQIVKIVKLFRAKKAPMDVLVRCVCIMWECIVDIEQFSAVLKEIGEENFDSFRLEIFHRLGVCNLWDFLPIGEIGSVHSYIKHCSRIDVLPIVTLLIMYLPCVCSRGGL